MSDAVSVQVWMAVVVGACTALATAYGMYRTWQQRRQEGVQRLAQAAQLAVRRTESAYVRPILHERLEMCLMRFASAHRRILEDGDSDDIMRTRFLLFCELQRTVRLTDEERHAAQTMAVIAGVVCAKKIEELPNFQPIGGFVADASVTADPSGHRKTGGKTVGMPSRAGGARPQ